MTTNVINDMLIYESGILDNQNDDNLIAVVISTIC